MEMEVCRRCEALLSIDGQGRVFCRECGEVPKPIAISCFECGTIQLEGEKVCGRCGKPLYETCPQCGGENWLGAEFCGKCGKPMQSLQHTFRSFQDNYKLQRAQQQSSIAHFREQEEASSRKRLSVFEETDRKRLVREKKAAEWQQQKENRIVRWVGIGALLILVAGILLVLILL